MKERLDKLLANTGLVTRSGARDALKMGRVQVDGITVRDGAGKYDPQMQIITLDGAPIASGRVVLLLNKPSGYVTSTEDPRDKTVMELIPQQYRSRVTPVGRLDKLTEGLLLFTDDGALAHRLISPKNRVPKLYYARHEGRAGQDDVTAFRQGLTLGDGTVCLPAELCPLGAGESLITVYEGKYHQVRRMMASRGMTVTYLERRQEGKLSLGGLSRGQTRLLAEDEIQALLESHAD